jgi:hypothetical protein
MYWIANPVNAENYRGGTPFLFLYKNHMFSFFKSKSQNKVIDVNLNQQNAIWLLNEELQRLHQLFNAERKVGGSVTNLNIYWGNIQTLQQKVIELASKAQDPDLSRAIADLQNHVVDQIILEEK